MTAASPRDSRRAREIERTRQDILDAAARVFGAGGYHVATMQAIAREAGFTAASLYTYFPSKDAIHQALREDLKRRVLAIFDEPEPAGLSFAQRLELLLQRQFALVAERLDALRAFFDAPPPSPSQERDARTAYLERTARFLGNAGRGELLVAPREAALALFGLAHGWVFPWLLGEEEPDPPRLAARVVNLFLHGAAGPAQHRAPPTHRSTGEPP